MKRLMTLALALVFSFFIFGEAKTQTPAPAPEIKVLTERDFGYHIGDLIKIRYEIKIPDGFRLSLNDLPRISQEIAQGIEIRDRKIKEIKAGAIYRLELTMQIFRAFSEAKNLAIPPIDFYFGPKENPRQYKGALPQTAVKISPLCGEEEPLFQPIFEPEKEISRIGLTLIFTGGIIAIFGWLTLAWFIIQSRRHPSPLKQALKIIRKLGCEDYRKILLIFRRAMNEKAGQAIFSHNLDGLFKVFPMAKARQKEIGEIIALSDNLSFNPEFRPDSKKMADLKKLAISVLKCLIRREQWN
ncbi:MAG: hypothetical protein Q8L57_00165 [bacterium]|nr:hypothetical protein [bacterium]